MIREIVDRKSWADCMMRGEIQMDIWDTLYEAAKRVQFSWQAFLAG